MIYSLNEIDAHCKKAARGIGFEWGYAEDIGKVARWLACFELPGVSLLCDYLTQIKCGENNFNAPLISKQELFQANNGILCPIVTGSYLSDALIIHPDQKHSFEQLGFPLLLLPFLSRLADQAKLSVSYRYDNNQFNYADGKLKYSAIDTLTCDYVEHADCKFTSEKVDGENALVVGQQVEAAIWMKLNEYAYKTYVPATEESRRGAGPSE